MKNRIICSVMLILSLALGAYCVYASFAERGDYFLIIGYVIIILLCFWLASSFHEMGHMLFGLFAKVKVILVRIRILSSSSCKIIPKTDKGLKGRIIVTTLGGVAVNLLFIALGIVALCVPAVPTEWSLALPASFYIFAVNVLPLHFESGKTDGLVISEIAKGEDAAKVLLAVLTVQAQVLNGKPIAEVEESLLFDLPQIREDDPAFIALCELRYEYSNAKGETEKAEAYKSRFEELKKEYQ